MNKQATILDKLGRSIIGRDHSWFIKDFDKKYTNVSELLKRSRVLVVGGAGSIGSQTVKLLARFEVAELDVVDISENYLAELVRDLRSANTVIKATSMRFLPLDYTSVQMSRFLNSEKPYDYVLNFAALKHVRSEKDVFSLLQMLHVNVTGQSTFKRKLNERGSLKSFFSVSTDKASNPTSMMGASKRIMEDVVFDSYPEVATVTTSARFANVAFSNGSLPLSYLTRIEKNQPLAVPADTKRYFVTLRESGLICMLAAFDTPDQHILIPAMNPEDHLILLEDVASKVLEYYGYEAEFMDDEDRAKGMMIELQSNKKWPVLRTPLNTVGEKPYEEFCADGETSYNVGHKSANVIEHQRGENISDTVRELSAFISDENIEVDTNRIKEVFLRQLETFSHKASDQQLDQRM